MPITVCPIGCIDWLDGMEWDESPIQTHIPERRFAGVWHPWRALRSLLTVNLIWTDLFPAGVLGATDGTRIWMIPRQLQAERRCTLTYELVHIERGHVGCQPPAIEAAVHAEVARRLIPSIPSSVLSSGLEIPPSSGSTMPPSTTDSLTLLKTINAALDARDLHSDGGIRG